MRMEAAETSEPFHAYSGALQVRQHDPARVSDDNVFYITAPVDEHADLSAYFTRNLSQMSSKLLSHDLAGMNAPLVKLLQSVDLALFQTLQIAFDTYSCLPPGSLLLTQQHDLTSKDETPHARVE